MQLRAKVFVLPFLRKEQIAKDTYCFFFDVNQSDFHFLPGQYIQMTLPHKKGDERGSSRFFTVASSPTEKEYLMITTRIGISSFKKALFNLQAGTEVQFFGPIGTFTLLKEA